jgi:hypothetical protein
MMRKRFAGANGWIVTGRSTLRVLGAEYVGRAFVVPLGAPFTAVAPHCWEILVSFPLCACQLRLLNRRERDSYYDIMSHGETRSLCHVTGPYLFPSSRGFAPFPLLRWELATHSSESH